MSLLDFSRHTSYTSTAVDPEFEDFGPPFDDASADIILRSNDKVDFDVHKLILSIASPIFKDMFTLPPPGSHSGLGAGRDEVKQGLPVVLVDDDERSLNLMLHFCYPLPDPPLDDFEDMKKILRIAHKYQLENVRSALISRLMQFAQEQPERVFAIAWAYEMKDVSVAAAKHTLRQPFLPGPDIVEFLSISGMAIQKLLQYQRACIASVQQLVSDKTWITAEDLPGCLSTICECGGQSDTMANNVIIMSRIWWWEYMGRAQVALKTRPCASTVTSLELISPSLMDAAECTACKPEASASMEHFTRRFAQEIDRVISMVSFRFEAQHELD